MKKAVIIFSLFVAACQPPQPMTPEQQKKSALCRYEAAKATAGRMGLHAGFEQGMIYNQCMKL